jgi:hypothetical protein
VNHRGYGRRVRQWLRHCLWRPRQSRLRQRLQARQPARYYRLLRAMAIEMNHADYRLMSRRAIGTLRGYREVNLYLRGIIPMLGFTSTTIAYTRAPRFAGKTKYPLRKMLKLALDGITSFSAVPLRIITMIGFCVSAISGGLGLWALYVALFTEQAVRGWTSTVVPTYFLGGIQLLSIGIIGEYLARIYLEVKARPRYTIDQIVGEGVATSQSFSPLTPSRRTRVAEKSRT